MKRAFNYLAKQNPKLLQELWERHTPAGRKSVERSQLEADIIKAPAKPDINKLLTALEDAQYRYMGITFNPNVAVYRYVATDREVDIHVHRNKGDLYGVFRKINETRIDALITELTTNQTRVLTDLALTLNEKVVELHAVTEAGFSLEPGEVGGVTDLLRSAVTVLRGYGK